MDYVEALLHELPAGGLGLRTLEVVTLPAPAAGADFTITVPGRELWHPISIRARLATDATVANRATRLEFDDGATVFATIRPGGTIAASSNARFGWFHGASQPTGADVGTAFNQAIPRLVMRPGWRILTITSGIGAGDQWSEIALLVEKAQLDPAALQARYAGHRAAGFEAQSTEEG